MLLRDDRRRVVQPEVKKASRCLSVIIHLSPEDVKGTYLPKAAYDHAMESWRTLACDEHAFESKQMRQGSASVFYHDVVHYGPEHPRTANGARWVLFVMFSPEKTARQAAVQEYYHCN